MTYRALPKSIQFITKLKVQIITKLKVKNNQIRRVQVLIT